MPSQHLRARICSVACFMPSSSSAAPKPQPESKLQQPTDSTASTFPPPPQEQQQLFLTQADISPPHVCDHQHLPCRFGHMAKVIHGRKAQLTDLEISLHFRKYLRATVYSSSAWSMSAFGNIISLTVRFKV